MHNFGDILQYVSDFERLGSNGTSAAISRLDVCRQCLCVDGGARRGAGLRYREVLGLGVFALVFVAVALGARTLGGAVKVLIAPFVWRGVNLVAASWGQRALPKRVLSRRNFPWWGWAGLAVMVGEWVLAWNRFAFIAPVQRFTYIPLWMGLIVALKGWSTSGADIRR